MCLASGVHVIFSSVVGKEENDPGPAIYVHTGLRTVHCILVISVEKAAS